jgi:hypothetical protein
MIGLKSRVLNSANVHEFVKGSEFDARKKNIKKIEENAFQQLKNLTKMYAFYSFIVFTLKLLTV